MAVDYSNAEQDRELLISQRQRRTAKAFEEMRKQIDEQIATMNMSTVSEKVKRQQLEEILYKLQQSLEAFYSGLEIGLQSDMVTVGQSVLNDSMTFYNALNMPISAAITSFPVEIMENVVNGSVYGQKWFLSGALWGDYQSKLDDINEVITNGIGLNLPVYDIAKNLEKYVDPNACKDWDWSKVYPGSAKKVDYNAQRLARTLISHAYQQNVVRQAQANPFATGVKWEASGGERMCEICEERDGKIFPVDEVPLDHPNGMCTFSVETPSMMEMSNVLADWANGEPTDWDDQLDAWYEGRLIDHGKDVVNKIQYSQKQREDYAKRREERLAQRSLKMDFYNADINKVKEYALSKLHTKIDFKYASEQAIRDTVDLVSRFESIGINIGDVKIVFGGTKGNYGYFDPKTKEIHLHRDDGFVQKMIEENRRSLFKSGKVRWIDSTYQGMAAHEIGHAFDRYFNQDISREIARRGLLAKAFSISSYAATEPAYGSPRASEAVAENISAYLAGGETREKIDKDVLSVLEEYFKKLRKSKNIFQKTIYKSRFMYYNS